MLRKRSLVPDKLRAAFDRYIDSADKETAFRRVTERHVRISLNSKENCEADVLAQFSGISNNPGVILSATTDAVWLVDKVIAVTKRLLGALVDRYSGPPGMCCKR